MHGKSFLRLVIVFLLIFLGILIGIFLFPSMHDTSFQILLGISIIFVGIVAYSAIRLFIVRQSKTLKSSGQETGRSEVSFVVDTFQELVGKLKEKEKELEKLRSTAEDRAVRMETYNENILQSVPSGVISFDNSMKIKSINQSAETTLGVKAEDVLNKDCAEVFDEPLLGIVRGGGTLYRGEYEYVTRDDRHIWLGITTSQLRNAAHETIGLILVFTDLTDVKALQAQVDLKKRLSQLGEMSAGIAHELRNPMSVISGYAKLLSKKVEASNKATVNAILTEIDNIDSIITEFLAFARPTDLNKTPVDIKKMIEETAATVVGDNKSIEVKVRAESDITLMADEVLLRQAFTNLFINAVDAMPAGGSLEVSLSGTRDKIRIDINDTGQGIPKDIKNKIFLPFYTSKEKGIGLGLAIVQKVIVSHGGSIDVDSMEGRGTLFRIALPAAS
jgi:two-component system sensor histidine kinase PilS (NtrC family)